MYYIKGIKDIIQLVGGEFNDVKERPVVALMQSYENPKIFWAIPVGNYNHRREEKIKRIESFMNCPQDDIRSCYYHIGKTNIKSIFFISDVFPVSQNYILREYLSYHSKHHVLKNPNLISALNEKLNRILAFEKSKLNKDGRFYFRQNIWGIYDRLDSESKSKSFVADLDGKI